MFFHKMHFFLLFGFNLDQTLSLWCSKRVSRIKKKIWIILISEDWIQGGFQEQNVITIKFKLVKLTFIIYLIFKRTVEIIDYFTL